MTARNVYLVRFEIHTEITFSSSSETADREFLRKIERIMEKIAQNKNIALF